MDREPRPRLALALVALVSLFNYMDRMVLPAVAQPIKQEFGLSDAQLGLLTGFAFVILYGLSGVPLARLADRTSRSLVLAGALAVWSVATAACGLARTYMQLILARAVVGIGESACQPVGYALVTELCPPEKRGRAMSWFLVGNSVGILLGFALGGWIAARWGWRMAFIAVGLPGLLLAASLVWVRGRNHATPDREQLADLGLWQALRQLLSNPEYRWLVVLNAVYGFTIFGPISWLPAFFLRSHQLSIDVVGLWTGLAIGAGMAAGMVLGGQATDRLMHAGPDKPQYVGALAIVASALSFIVVLTTGDPTVAFVATFFATMLGSIASPAIVIAIQNECPPQLRATGSAIVTLVISVVGVGFAPFVIGVLSDLFAPELGQESLRRALLASLAMCAVTALLHLHVGRRLVYSPNQVRA